MLAVGVSLALGSWCPRLLAQSEPESQPSSQCTGSKPWVELSAELPRALADAVLSELGAGLEPSSIEVCAAEKHGASATPPLAHVTIAVVEGRAARYSLNVTDSVTQKRVARDLALGRLPPDGRALALAVAAEELLRASWAELALRGVHTAKTAAPPEVRAVVEEPRKPKPLPLPRRFVALGGRVAFERFSGAQTHYGADLFAVVPTGSVAALLLEAGVRRALSEASTHGSIAASGMSAGVGVGLSAWQRGGFELQPFVSAHLLRLHFDPEAKPGSDEQAKSGWVVTTRAGVSLAFGAAGVVRSYTALGAGPVLKSFSASDDGRVVTGASGVEVFATAGLALELF